MDGLGFYPGMGKRFFPSPACPDWIFIPLSLLFNGHRVSFLGVKWWRCEVTSI